MTLAEFSYLKILPPDGEDPFVGRVGWEDRLGLEEGGLALIKEQVDIMKMELPSSRKKALSCCSSLTY